MPLTVKRARRYSQLIQRTFGEGKHIWAVRLEAQAKWKKIQRVENTDDRNSSANEGKCSQVQEQNQGDGSASIVERWSDQVCLKDARQAWPL